MYSWSLQKPQSTASPIHPLKGESSHKVQKPDETCTKSDPVGPPGRLVYLEVYGQQRLVGQPSLGRTDVERGRHQHIVPGIRQLGNEAQLGGFRGNSEAQEADID